MYFEFSYTLAYNEQYQCFWIKYCVKYMSLEAVWILSLIKIRNWREGISVIASPTIECSISKLQICVCVSWGYLSYRRHLTLVADIYMFPLIVVLTMNVLVFTANGSLFPQFQQAISFYSPLFIPILSPSATYPSELLSQIKQ